MSLPQKCLYQNKINASYARNFNSVIQAQNTNNYGVGQTAIFNIPCMRNQVLSGADTMLSLRLRIANGATAANFAYLNRAGIAGAIQRLRIFSGSQLLCDIDNYGNLMSFLTSYQVGTDHTSGKLDVLQGCGALRGRTLLSNVAANLDSANFDFCFPLLSILSLTDNYVPLWALSGNGPLRLEIQFVSTLAAFIGSTTAITNHSAGANSVFSDVKLIANFVELSDQAMDIIQSSLQGKPVQWVCQSYSNYVFNAVLRTGSTTQISMPIPAKFNSLNALYITMRQNADGAISRYPDDCNNFRLSSYTTRIGSRVIPSEPPSTIPQFIAETERALGSASSRVSPSCYALTQITRETPVTDLTSSSCFVVGVETESYSSAPMGSVYQGLNTSTDDIFYQASFAAQATQDNTVRFDAYASYDQLITIDNGQVSVQY